MFRCEKTSHKLKFYIELLGEENIDIFLIF